MVWGPPKAQSCEDIAAGELKIRSGSTTKFDILMDAGVLWGGRFGFAEKALGKLRISASNTTTTAVQRVEAQRRMESPAPIG
jgi:hypothetical protein